MIRSFLQDYRDQRASGRSDMQAVDVLAALSLALGMGVQVAGQLDQLRANVLPVPLAGLDLVLAALGVAWAAAVIRATTAPPPAGEDSPYLLRPRPAYRFGQPARTVAKVLLPILIVYAGVRTLQVTMDARSLPGTVYGYLVDESNRPRARLRVAVVSSRGEQLALSRYETDDRGFYVVRAARRIPRDARLRIVDAGPECASAGPLSLARPHRLPPADRPASVPRGTVVFRHVVSCPAAP